MHSESNFDSLGEMLELRPLRYLVTLGRVGNYARAAEELGISQPSLTRAIQALERRLGMRLLDRDRSGVKVTPQGRIFIDGAAVLVANAEELESKALQAAEGMTGRVRFGMAPMPARALLAATVDDRVRTAPEVTNDVVVRSVEALWPLLTDGAIEFFASAEGQVPDAPPVREEILGQFPISLIVRRGHPLLTGECPGQTFPLLLSSRGDSVLPDALRKLAHGKPHIIEDFGSLASLAASSDAIWLSSIFSVADELRAGILCELPVDLRMERRWARISMYSLERRSLSPATRALVHAMRKKIRSLTSELAKPETGGATGPG